MRIRYLTFFISFFVLLNMLFLGTCFAVQEESAQENIKYILETSPEIEDFIPELVVERDEKGNIEAIKYETDGVLTDINDLDEDTLSSLRSRVGSENARIQTERIQNQLAAVRAVQNIPRLPAVNTPPSVPQIPDIPAVPPKVPVPPRLPNTSRR